MRRWAPGPGRCRARLGSAGGAELFGFETISMGTPLGVGNGNSLQYSGLENPMDVSCVKPLCWALRGGARLLSPHTPASRLWPWGHGAELPADSAIEQTVESTVSRAVSIAASGHTSTPLPLQPAQLLERPIV